MARTILRDEARLNQLTTELAALVAAIDNEENVPERYESTLAGALAGQDAELLSLARDVVFRLELWARFPGLDRPRYTRELDRRTGPRSVA